MKSHTAAVYLALAISITHLVCVSKAFVLLRSLGVAPANMRYSCGRRSSSSHQAHRTNMSMKISSAEGGTTRGGSVSDSGVFGVADKLYWQECGGADYEELLTVIF